MNNKTSAPFDKTATEIEATPLPILHDPMLEYLVDTLYQKVMQMTDMAELFSRDPALLTRENIDDMIKVYRKARHQFVLGNISAGATKKVTAPKPKITNLDDLDIEL